MKLRLCFLLALLAFPGAFRAATSGETNFNRVAIALAPDSYWWAGIIEHGFQMPLTNGYEADLAGDTYGNQGQPLLLSSQGDVIWSEDALEIQLSRGELVVQTRNGPVCRAKSGACLRKAFLYASKTHFPPSGKIPNELLFTAPQYNTWIELMYDQNQKDVLKYAGAIRDHGLPPGVLMIDDCWQQNYGQWDFKRDKFPDAEAMVKRLHEQGFKVMLWICPFVNSNCSCYQELAARNLLLKDRAGTVASIKWWDGQSALLDFTNPKAAAWFRAQLDRLQSVYGVDGFKFDAGDSSFYQDTVASQPVSPNTQSELYGKIGLNYPLNEYRAMWKMGGQPLAERLRDKEHSWTDLGKLVPNLLLEGLMGYPFSCPDMIGGGECKSFQAGATIDQDLVVRSAQCHALMPMMQFSVAPWRILDTLHFQAVLKAVKVRQDNKDYILSLARQSALTGEPMVRSLEYSFPHQGYARIHDQFLLGDEILVAPILEKAACKREVTFPAGAWEDGAGRRYDGPARVWLPVAEDELCYFRKVGRR